MITAQQLLDGSPTAIIAITSDGVTLTWCAGAERIFGVSEEHALGVPISQLAGTGELVFGDGVLEAEGTHRSGRPLTLVIAVRPFDGSRWIVTITDVTLLRARDSRRITS